MGVVEPRERFGVVLRAFQHVFGGVNRLMEKLGDGSLEAFTLKPPPPSSIPHLDDANAPGPQWWGHFGREFAFGGGPGKIELPSEWLRWLYHEVEIAVAPAVDTLVDLFEAERSSSAKRIGEAPNSATWSDLQAIAWVASRDTDLPSIMASFRPVGSANDDKIRSRGLRYLRFRVAQKHCQCNAKNPLLVLNYPEMCSCLHQAWDCLTAGLISGEVTATLVSKDSNVSLAPHEFAGASFSRQDGPSWPLIRAEELLLDARKAAKINAPIPAQFTEEEIKAWIIGSGYTDVKKGRTAFMRLPRAKGLSATFEVVWGGIFGRPQGRPKGS